MVIPVGLEKVLSMDPDVMHGELCFAGTRVPLTVLLDNLDEGMGVDDFVQEYPSVSRDQALTVVGWQQDRTRVEAGIELAS
ncbi:MAG: DUF433 domain-containing protein [Armatimonadetes bacterium]|nr:DUF433 domain-containing protein [Armatimonadota bacterium]